MFICGEMSLNLWKGKTAKYIVKRGIFPIFPYFKGIDKGFHMLASFWVSVSPLFLFGFALF